MQTFIYLPYTDKHFDCAKGIITRYTSIKNSVEKIEDEKIQIVIVIRYDDLKNCIRQKALKSLLEK